MPGARLRVEVTGLDNVERRLRALATGGRDLTPVMRDIGEYLVRSTKERFRDEVDPAGAPWTPLTESTRRRKKRNAGRVLTQDGHLGGTIAFQAGAHHVDVGSPLIYAGTHQFGATKGAFGTTGRGTPIPWGDIPARPFLGVSNEDEGEIRELVAQYLAEQLG